MHGQQHIKIKKNSYYFSEQQYEIDICNGDDVCFLLCGIGISECYSDNYKASQL